MSAKSQTQEIDRKAAEWAAKAEEGFPASEQAALDAWLAADIRHVGAYAKATAVLARLDRARAIGLRLDRQALSSVRPTRRQLVLTGSVAASLAALGLAADLGWRYWRESYVTRVGETEIVPLNDGSVITLNTNSALRVHYTEATREVTLLRGEALFDVAKNKAQPFVVLARDTQVRAIGTSFTVSVLLDQPVKVLVREGVVEVKRPNVPVAAPVRVAANVRVVVPGDAPIATTVVTPVEVARALAWRVGRISFDDETLADAAREFARYSNTHIVIDDPAIAKRTVTGLFVSNDPIGFAKAVALSLDVHADVGDGEVRLTR